MSRMSILNSPFMLGFDDIERMLDRATKISGDGYPPYNIERIAPASAGEDKGPERLRITLAVAGFTDDDLDIVLEDNQLSITGKQTDDKSRTYLHRGIAARQFRRNFVLAEGIEVVSATLQNGLLAVDLARPTLQKQVRKIAINTPLG